MTNYASLASKITKVYEVSSFIIDPRQYFNYSLQIFDKVFTDYSLSSVFLAFNGGKDCTLLLDLLIRYINENPSKFNESEKASDLRIIYIQPQNPFDEVERFVDDCKTHYNVKIQKESGNIKTILESVCQDNLELKAVFMGSRRTDPYCENLKELQQTDPGWPPLLRVNPILDWVCADVWNYIRSESVPYCTLYDEGYTSLGDKTNTTRNPNLEVINAENGNVSYRPAYELSDDSKERAGRL